ncbi:LIC_10190 family membrane protein [Leptolyngbya sp. AN03gr2]|uniref:LIC_10190 family membrane protein n=1 Tax=unclassified Leptolyngbya TaxID=2650499 RepID=UPI003D317101
MFYFIVVWLILLIVCGIIGTGILKGLRVSCFDRMGDRAVLSLWLGVIVMSIALLVTSWFLPLSPLTGIILAAIFCGLSFKSARSELVQLFTQLHPKQIPLLLMLLVGIAAFIMQPVTWMDSGYYHAQVIQWFGKFGAVPGLALLFNHLGFTSSWFAFAAPLNAVSLEGRVLAIANGFALLLAILHCGMGLFYIARSQAKLCDWFIVCFSIILLPTIVQWNHILAEIFVSPSPDIPVLFITGTIAWSMIAIAESEQRSAPQNRLLPVILAGGAFTFKLIALPLVAVTGVFYLLNKQLNLKHLLLSLVILVGLLSPVLIHGVIVSGCPLYPSTKLCFDLPWTPDREAVQQIASRTHQWIPEYQSNSSGLVSEIQQRWRWFEDFIGNPKIVASLLLASIVSLIGLFSIRKRPLGSEWIAGLAIAGITFFFLTSPLTRFWITYLSMLPILWLAIYCRSQIKLKIAKLPQTVLVVPIFLTTILLFNYLHSHSVAELLLPPARSSLPTSQIAVNNIVINVPNEGVHCWATEIPCVPKPQIPKRIQLRDPERGIGAGFARN